MNTPAARQEFARETAAEIRAAQTAKADALAANETDQQRLRTLASEIAEAEARLDPEDLGAIQLLAAKREQHSRLLKKYSAEAGKRLAHADKKLRDAIRPNNFADLFRAENADFMARIADVLKPFVKHRERALQIARETDAANDLGRLVYLTTNSMPVNAGEMLAALDGIADGKTAALFA